ncbi:MAG TPA: alpha/beta fold hydrolase [Pseudonocardia sp.]|jgi:pimeloyl-ACP methyl ester carboxylesterase
MIDEQQAGPFASRRIQVGDIALNVIDEGEGPAVLLLHGFPDRATMWRHQIRALVAAGHRVIAPDLRGFGDSDKPARVENYALTVVVQDMLGLLDELGVDTVAVAAHDWGAMVGWVLTGAVPERVRRLAAISVGHPNAYFGAGFAQKQLSWYMLWFQFPGVAEQQMPVDDWAWFRRWIHAGAERGQDPDLDQQLADLARPGALAAGLSWYRANMPPEVFAQREVDFGMATITCPVLGIWSNGDPALTERQMTDSAEYLGGPWRCETLAGVDHWIPVHAAERTSELLVDFFG